MTRTVMVKVSALIDDEFEMDVEDDATDVEIQDQAESEWSFIEGHSFETTWEEK